MAVTISEIAKKAGVGVGTVSRYLNNQPHVSESKKDRIKEAIEELDYTPSAIAAQLRSKSTKNIGFLVSRISNPFLANLFDMCETRLNELGYQVFVTQTHDDSSAEQRFLEKLKTHQVDGVIMASVENESLVADMAKDYADKIVVVNEHIDNSNLKCVVLDHYQATYDALQYLYGNGKRHIAYATGGEYKGLSHGQSRTKAYKDFCQCHQLKAVTEHIFTKVHTIDDGILMGEQIRELSVKTRPDAVFTNSDEVAIGLIDSLRKQHIKVPEDIAVIGYDDQPMAQFSVIPLTTIQQPVQEMADLAITLLMQGLTSNNQTQQENKKLALRLIVRASA